MSSGNTWFTKEDLMKDLAKVSGRRVIRGGNLDENHIVVGNAPPPIMFEAEDEEMLRQFGVDTHDRGIQCDAAPPDLEGITNMIRMVQESDGDALSDGEDITPNSNCVIAISKFSNLNPHVREFVPKGASSQSSSDISEKMPSKTDVNEQSEGKNKVDAACEVTNSAVSELEDIAAQLKNKIKVTSKCDSFESKKQNNVAIASLLRLYATNNNKSTNSESVTEPMKLITPDFYENRATTSKDVQLSPQSSSTAPAPVSELSNSLSTSSIDAKSEPILGTRFTPMKLELDPAVKTSIEKVNQWMEGEKLTDSPSKKKGPAIYIGPVAFKRKEPKTSKLPAVSEPEPKQTTSPVQVNQWRPSTYAADLGKKYMERNKTKEAQKYNAWTDLDVILKQKDEIILKKRLEQASQHTDVDSPQR